MDKEKWAKNTVTGENGWSGAYKLVFAVRKGNNRKERTIKSLKTGLRFKGRALISRQMAKTFLELIPFNFKKNKRMDEGYYAIIHIGETGTSSLS